MERTGEHARKVGSDEKRLDANICCAYQWLFKRHKRDLRSVTLGIK